MWFIQPCTGSERISSIWLLRRLVSGRWCMSRSREVNTVLIVIVVAATIIAMIVAAILIIFVAAAAFFAAAVDDVALLLLLLLFCCYFSDVTFAGIIAILSI